MEYNGQFHSTAAPQRIQPPVPWVGPETVCGKEIPEIETRFLDRQARTVVVIPAELSRLETFHFSWGPAKNEIEKGQV
jgi:hypothetical protein